MTPELPTVPGVPGVPPGGARRAHAPRASGARGEADARVFQELIQRLAGRTAAFARYRVEGEVGKGGMGAILRVVDVDLRRDLAMKVMLQRGERLDERHVARFAEEAQITGQLEHPGIVPVHDLGLDDQGRMFFTMRLVRGRDFEQIIGLIYHGTDEEWTLTRGVGVLLKVCEAMAYAHSKHVIHRDLKPANVMVGHFGEVYVMDWGLARLLDVLTDSDTSVIVRTDRDDVREAGLGSALLTMAGDIMGTPTHMSPEQARGDLAAMGPASDVYSTGAILYHLLAGHAPFAEPGASLQAADVWKRVKSGPPVPIEERAPSAPPELCAICERAMERKIEDRYPSMQAMARDLRAYLEGRVVGAYETGAVAEFKKWVRRNKALALTSLSAGVIIVSGLAIASLVLARKNTQLTAITAEAVASATRRTPAKVLRLSDVKRLQQLTERAEALWPAHPSNAEPMRRWLASAGDLLGREELHLAELARLRGLAGVSAGDDESTRTFANTEDQWQHDTLVDLTADLERLRDPELGLVREVEDRLRFAESVEEQSRTGPEARALWDETRLALADRSRYPAYAGLELAPQLGLLPLGPDPHSGLFEFAHLQTGTPARRNAEDGGLEISAETGLVFVLLPGGPFRRGQPTGPRGEEEVDPVGARRAGRAVLRLEVRDDPGAVVAHHRRQPEHLRGRAGVRRPHAGPLAPRRASQLARLLRDARQARPGAAERGPMGVRRERRHRQALVDRLRARVAARSRQPRRPDGREHRRRSGPRSPTGRTSRTATRCTLR